MKTLKVILGVVYVALIVLLLIHFCKPREEEPEEWDANIMVVDAETHAPLHAASVFVTTTDPDCPEDSMLTNESGRCLFTFYDNAETLTAATGRKAGYCDSTLTNIPLEVFEDEDYVLIIPLRKDVPPPPPIPPDTIIQHDTIYVPQPPTPDPPRQDPPRQQNPPQDDRIDQARRIGQMGDLKVTLQYNASTVDIDLHVVQPTGQEIYFGHMNDNRTGGHMDKDWLPSKPLPIAENIYWNNPPSGNYRVYLKYYNPSNGPAVNCTVTVFQNGQQPRQYNARLMRKGETKDITTVRVP